MTEVHGSEEAVAALFAALAQARETCTLVRRASHSKIGAYASSEHIMVVSRKALKDTGLSVTPLDSELAPHIFTYFMPREAPTSIEAIPQLILKRGFLVAHKDGAYYRASMSWPVVYNRGTDAAKGAGSAETMSFAYFLRTLLMMPRMGQDDMDNPGIQATMAASRQRVAPAVHIEGMTAPAPEEFDAEESARLDAEVAAGERQGLFDE